MQNREGSFDGLEYSRLNNNGDVSLKTEGGKEVRIPGAVWCSIISTLSMGGEENGRWYRAVAFHQGDGAPTPSDKLQP